MAGERVGSSWEASVQAAKIQDAEQWRQKQIDDLAAEHGPGWFSTFKPGSFGCHELLDRTSMVAGVLDQYVLSHPACVLDADWFALAWQASQALAELYHRVGARHLDEPSNEAPQAP
jgi:hypothetical protein